MRNYASVIGLSFLLALSSCGEGDGGEPDDSTDQPEPATPEEVPTPDRAVADSTGYTIHEWGLIDIDLGDNTVEYAAGPGQAEAGSSGNGSGSNSGSGTTRPGTRRNDDAIDTAVGTANELLRQFGGGNRPIIQRRRKPVLYFHLTDTNPDFTFDLTVNLGTGRVVEHFPAGTLGEHTVAWTGVGLASTSCTGGPYPTAESPICTEVADGYCEAAELEGYVADDAGCLSVGDQEQNFLFYRGDGPGPTLPVNVERGNDGTVTLSNTSLGGTVGPVLRFRRDTDGAIKVARVAMPEQGHSIAIGLPADAASDEHRTIVRDELRRIGLSEAEATAFETAWFGELFDGEAETPHAFPDAILFFLPQESIDAFAHLEATPAPTQVVRAMALRAGWTDR